jgi:seryl-tRNA synthetase
MHIYSVEGTDLCLAGTAEIPLGGMHMDSMLPEASLPLKLVAFSHCFRTEAGAAGAATRLVLACFTIHLELECPLAFFLVRIIILSMI